MNPNGNPASLDIAREGNANAAKYHAYSPRLREGRARELAAQVMELSPVATSVDLIAAHELGALLAHAEAIERALEEGGPINPRRQTVRALLDIRLRVDRRIAEWTARLGLDPASRARVARDLAGGTLAVELAQLAKERVDG